jgi:hypothetical protein
MRSVHLTLAVGTKCVCCTHLPVGSTLGLYCTCAGHLADKVHQVWTLIDNGTMTANNSVIILGTAQLSFSSAADLAAAQPWPESASGSWGQSNRSPVSGTTSSQGSLGTGMGSSGSSSGSGSGWGGFSSGRTAPIPLPRGPVATGLAAAPNSVWVMVLGAALALHVAVVFG